MAWITGARHRAWCNAGPPSSGTGGTLAGEIGAKGELLDTTNGVLYINEGTQASPYYTPLPYDQPQLFGVNTDWRDGVGVAISGTAGSVLVAGSGVRIFGQGADETDSGAVANTAGEGGTTMRLTTTNETSHTICLGMAAGVMQPDQHQLLVVDAELTNVTAITERALQIGFVGTAADAFDPVVTAATTVATLVQDDMCVMGFDVGYTDADRLYIAHNKSNANATMTAVDTSTNIAAAGTYQRLRVEIAADGDATFFIDKAQVSDVVAIALDVDEECSPILCLEAIAAAATKSIDVRRFATWAYR